MKRIVQLAAIAAVLYLGYDFAKPWVDELRGGGVSSGGAESQVCVGALVRNVEEFREKAAKWGGPPVQADRWSGAHKLLVGRMRETAADCECQSEACDLARLAMREFRKTVKSVDRSLRARDPVDLSGRLAETMVLLDQARASAAAGY